MPLNLILFDFLEVGDNHLFRREGVLFVFTSLQSPSLQPSNLAPLTLTRQLADAAATPWLQPADRPSPLRWFHQPTVGAPWWSGPGWLAAWLD